MKAIHSNFLLLRSCQANQNPTGFGLQGAAFHNQMQMFFLIDSEEHRITSYNVCYTKLLRIENAVVQHRRHDCNETSLHRRHFGKFLIKQGHAPVKCHDFTLIGRAE